MQKVPALSLLVVACAASAVCGIEPANQNLSASGREVLDYLESVYQKKMLAGYNVYVHTPDDYEQTAKRAAIWGRDIRWLGDASEVIAHAKKHRYILTLHWHWFFNEDSAWRGRREHPADVGRIVTPGTEEHKQVMKELAAAADTLEKLADGDIPVLWRPLHEIDGGWFWWTDRETPENTARLWRLMFDYFTKERKLDNLIWVYSAGVGKKKTFEYRKRFYPGADYVDISGIDIYGVDFQKDIDAYWDYYDVMARVSPGKMLVCGEGDAIPDPDKTQAGTLPRWLYTLPWWGAPSSRRPADWATFTMRHEHIITLDEMPPLGKDNIAPHVGILKPLDNGAAFFPDGAPVFEAYAVDRGGSVERVDFYAGERKIGSDDSAPYICIWKNAPAGSYDVTAAAVDNEGAETISNTIRTTVGLVDIARNKEVIASSGDAGEKAVDGDYYSAWASEKSGDQWIYVDLGREHQIERVNLMWGWKIHAQDFSIDVAIEDPTDSESWTTVHRTTDREYISWEATDRITFQRTPARYVRLHATKRAGNQTWSGYKLTALEVLVEP